MKSPFPPFRKAWTIDATYLFRKLQRRSDDWITTKLEKGLPVPCDLISRKAITASDVVKPTRGCNGVTKFPKSLKNLAVFIQWKVRSLKYTSPCVCMSSLWYFFPHQRDEFHNHCKFSESFGRCKGCCIKKATATSEEAQWLTSLPKLLNCWFIIYRLVLYCWIHNGWCVCIALLRLLVLNNST